MSVESSVAQARPGLVRAASLGRVVAIGGSQASLRLDGAHGAGGARDPTTVGHFLGVATANSLLIGVVTNLFVPQPEADGPATAQIDLLGEIRSRGGKTFFQRGVTSYPAIGDPVRAIDREELRLIYDISGPSTVDVGSLQQDASIGAYVDVDEMLRKHFAIFGTTGVGKSSGVALILRQVLHARPHLRVFLIDPHNEYGHCFDDRAQVLNPRNLRLPFWLFNFEEIVDVFFRGRPGIEEEVEILAEIIPLAKTLFASSRAAGDRPNVRRHDPKSAGFTTDTPVPYQLADLVALLNERMGKLENRSAAMKYQRLISRIEAVRNDPRYAFMFDNANVGGDTMVEVLSQLYRVPANGKPMTIMQLAGFPAEVVDSVVSVVCRMAFDFGLWSDGALPLLFVCEESHRYAPADRSLGFGPTRKALSRIAKEGRKYGVFLGLITQRPAELDTTIISQCSTLFAMRMANDRDQAIVRAAVSDAAAGLLSFVPSLGTREVFAFGEGVALPTRLHFKELPAHLVPKSESLSSGRLDVEPGVEKEFIAAVVERWRGAMMSQKLKADVGFDDFDTLAAQEFSAMPRPSTLDDARLGQQRGGEVVSPPAAPAAPPERTAQALSSSLQELRERLRSRGSR